MHVILFVHCVRESCVLGVLLNAMSPLFHKLAKIYIYNNEDLQWKDKGIGYVACYYVDRLMTTAIVVCSVSGGE